MQSTIHVAIGIHDPKGDYACHAGAMLAALFAHTASPVCAHVIHNETLTPDNQQRLQTIGQRFGKSMRFYKISLPESLHALGGHVTQGALFRLLLPDLVEVEKIIYFDCDIIVNMDIQQLWNIDLQGYPIAAALDPGMPEFPEHYRQKIRSTGVELENYFNSGVIVLNLVHLRKHYRLFQQAIGYLQRWPAAVFHDQDALNWLFQSSYLQLDPIYNKIVSRTPKEEFLMQAVWHFAGVKPWLMFYCPLDMLYWKALELTPWRETLLDRLAGVLCETMSWVNEQMNKDRASFTALQEKYRTLLDAQPKN